MARELFRLACFPVPGGEAEEERIEQINLALAGASPRITRSVDGHYVRNWRVRSLLESMYLMLYLDMTGGNLLAECESRSCSNYFRLGSQSKTLYCSERCANERCANRASTRKGRGQEP